jgi:murein DD-endopeptidase MepM/ murein hydrolase activator NlpD
VQDWWDRLAALAAVAWLGLASSVGALADRIEDAAAVTVGAVRGDDTQVAEPVRPTTTEYVVPVADVARAGWSPTHSTYPATDVFLPCGATLVSPVWGEVLQVRRVDEYDPAIDDPATRGGRSVAILGFDGVRYYLAHFESIVDGLAVGDLVEAGQVLGTMGDSGRTSACHLHFSISPPCPNDEWWVRRGVIWPYPYLDAWRAGEQRSPATEVEAWAAANPNACSAP